MAWEVGDIVVDSGCKIWVPEIGHLDILFREDSEGHELDSLYYFDGRIYEDIPRGVITVNSDDITGTFTCSNDVTLWEGDGTLVAREGDSVGELKNFFYLRPDGGHNIPFRFLVKNTDNEDVFIGDVDVVYALDLEVSDLYNFKEIDGECYKSDTSDFKNIEEIGTFTVRYEPSEYWEKSSTGSGIQGRYTKGTQSRTLGSPEVDYIFVADAPCWR